MEQYELRQQELYETLQGLLKALDGEQSQKNVDAGDLDRKVISVLTLSSALCTEQAFADFQQAYPLEERLWEVIGTAIFKYRKNAELRTTERLGKVIKCGKRFYREFIKRVVEIQGATEDLMPLLVMLKCEKLKETAKTPRENSVPRIYESISHSLCRLGDLSRYESSMTGDASFSHAKVYYRSGLTLNPSNGLCCNQLGTLAVSMGDYFYALYWFLKAQCVDKTPFSVNNVKKIATKIFQSNVVQMIKSPLGDDPDLSTDVKREFVKVVYSYAGLYLYKIIYNRSKGPVNSMSAVSDFKRLLSETKDGEIPVSLMIDLSLMGPMLSLQLDNENDDVLRLNLELLRCLLERGLLSFDGFVQSPDETVPKRLIPLLGAMRIYFDWLTKLLTHTDIDWEPFKGLFSVMFRFVELLRQEYGIGFDALTAVKTLSGQRALSAFEEEKKALCLVPWDGALNDTPSGISSSMKQDRAKFQCQCLIFSAIELSRLPNSYLKFDQFTLQFGFSESHIFAASDAFSDDNGVTTDTTTTVTSFNEPPSFPTTYIKDTISQNTEDDDDDEIVFKGRSI